MENWFFDHLFSYFLGFGRLLANFSPLTLNSPLWGTAPILPSCIMLSFVHYPLAGFPPPVWPPKGAFEIVAPPSSQQPEPSAASNSSIPHNMKTSSMPLPIHLASNKHRSLFLSGQLPFPFRRDVNC